MRCPVSVIIPCYRCAETIERAVESIARQTLLPEEVLLVDDGSYDEGKTLNILYHLQGQYQNKFQLKIIPLEKNGGPAGARNIGWDAAIQPYIAFLDADDEWHPKKLDIQYEYMRRNSEIAVTGHQYLELRKNKYLLHHSSISISADRIINPLSLLFKNCFPTSSVMIKNEIPFRFSVGKRFAEDYYLWQQMAFTGFQIVRIEIPLVHYYKALYGEGGLSGQLWKMEKGELSNFVALYREGFINWLLFIVATGFSITKYLMRLVVTMIKRASC